MEVIDLSQTIRKGMQIHPGDPIPSLRPHLPHEADQCHVDAPYHFIESGARIDTIPVNRFLGHGVLMDLSGKADHEAVMPEDIAPYTAEIEKGDFAILRTGWDRYFGTPRSLQHPFVTPRCAEMLRQKGVSLVGIDAMSVDPSSETGSPGMANGYPAHDIFLGNDILIVENLCNLGSVPQMRGLYSFLPLKLQDSDGSPIRAVFISS